MKIRKFILETPATTNWFHTRPSENIYTCPSSISQKFKSIITLELCMTFNISTVHHNLFDHHLSLFLYLGQSANFKF